MYKENAAAQLEEANWTLLGNQTLRTQAVHLSQRVPQFISEQRQSYKRSTRSFHSKFGNLEMCDTRKVLRKS